MFIFTFKYSLNKTLVTITIILIMILLALWYNLQSDTNISKSIFKLAKKETKFDFSNIKTNHDRIGFLKQFGWEVAEEPIEISNYEIPKRFDNTFLNYNDLQEKLGLNLTKYSGKRVKRYTYKILNHPLSSKFEIRANILVYKDKVIGGDIMTTGIGGFMESLLE